MRTLIGYLALALLALVIAWPAVGDWLGQQTIEPSATVTVISGEGKYAGMVYVPGGPFVMGSNAAADQMPVRTRKVGGFWIDRTEVTAAQFDRFLQERNIAPPAGPLWSGGVLTEALADHPAYPVPWSQARAYCRWAGKRLPTEVEWEKAARGVDARRYPWGNDWDPTRCNSSDRNIEQTIRSRPVGSFPAGASPCGALDMAGNVREWTEDVYEPDAYAGRRFVIKPFWLDAPHTLRGGSFAGNQAALSTTHRSHGEIDPSRGDFGFRCAADD